MALFAIAADLCRGIRFKRSHTRLGTGNIEGLWSSAAGSTKLEGSLLSTGVGVERENAVSAGI